MIKMKTLQEMIIEMQNMKEENLVIIKKRNVVLDGENRYQIRNKEIAEFLINNNGFELVLVK